PVNGRVDASFDVPRVNLLGGDYDLAVAASDQDAPQVMERLARFAVAGTSDGEGLVDMRGEGSVRTEVAAPWSPRRRWRRGGRAGRVAAPTARIRAWRRRAASRWVLTLWTSSACASGRSSRSDPSSSTPPGAAARPSPG